MKYSSKSELMSDCERQWKELWELLEGVSHDKLEKRIRIEKSDPRSIKDHLGHLLAWHLLLLKWLKSDSPSLPAAGFKWSQTRQLNAELHDQLRHVPAGTIVRRLKLSHRRVMKQVHLLNGKQLLKPGYRSWTGKLGLVSYIAPNTASHYRWAKKKLKKML